MGKIAEQLEARPVGVVATKRNKVDVILSRLDDDDRAIVAGWLNDPLMGCEEIEMRLLDADVECSDSTIRRWRMIHGVA